jgi:hypothetical protein
MKLFPALVSILVFLGASNQAIAGKKKHHKHTPPADDTSQTTEPSKEEPTADEPAVDNPAEDKPAKAKQPKQPKQPLDFDFFGDKAAGDGTGDSAGENPGLAAEREQQSQTRRWMLKTHQTLGIATWALMAATVTVGQLNYNQLYGGGGTNKWQGTHQILVLSTSVAFAATAAFAIFAPTPYKKPLHFDTGLVHRIAVIGASLGMVTEGLLGWWTTHQANAGNPNNLRTMARAHQIVGFTTFGFLTIAGTVWLF